VAGGTVAWVYAGMVLVAIVVGLIGQKRIRRLAKQEQQSAAVRQGLLVDTAPRRAYRLSGCPYRGTCLANAGAKSEA